jgi:hypothetical protein
MPVQAHHQGGLTACRASRQPQEDGLGDEHAQIMGLQVRADAMDEEPQE